MKPRVVKLGHKLWYCFSDYNAISFYSWQEALTEANRVAWREAVTRTLNQKGHIR